MDTWIQIISTYGVSIAAMIALAVYIVRKDKESQQHDAEFRQTITEIMQTHKSEVKELQDAINNNTIVMTKLCERIGER